ncbi:MAG: TonB-dependent receptor plug domain-containing protein [Bacteroidetes bacterium]|nr:TonB-dependent receptor plug domain-containing protein [Bacteroidota bacterium]
MQCFLPRFLLTAILLWFCVSLQAQQPADTLPELSLDQLLQLRALDSSSVTEAELSARIEAASQRPFSTRETPNVVTVITADEIRNSGARDLMDVLRLVPGIEFGVDVEGAVSLGIRGQWGAEGKVLVAVDGVEMNEIMYGFFTFGNDFQINAIKRVEVIRGPGSVVNGGFAALGVINIITRDVTEPDGLKVSSTVGATQTGFSRSGADILYSTHSADGWYLAMRGSAGNALRSDQPYTDFQGGSYTMRAASDLQRLDAGVNISGHGLSMNLFVRDYRVQTCAPYGVVIDTLNHISRFLQYRASITWNKKFEKGWSIQSGLFFNYDKPWNSGLPYLQDPAYNREGRRTRFSIGVGYSFNSQLAVNFGGQAFIDQAEALDSLNKFSINDSTNFVIRSQSLFSELILKTYWFNVVLGGRAEYNSEYGIAFVPRIGITRNFERFSFKILYNESFKAPTVENFDLQDTPGNLRPEYVKVGEIEFGYKFSRKAYLNANFFRTDIHNHIIYYFDAVTGEEFYTNGSRQISYGTEAEFIYRGAINQLRVSWSWYSVNNMPVNEAYAVSGNDRALLNFPQHKLTVTGTHVFPSGFVVNFTGHLVSERSLISGIDSLGNYQVSACAPDFLLSSTISRKNLLPGIDVALSVHNLLNRSYVIGMPYRGETGAYASLSREVVLRLTWHPQFNSPNIR